MHFPVEKACDLQTVTVIVFSNFHWAEARSIGCITFSADLWMMITCMILHKTCRKPCGLRCDFLLVDILGLLVPLFYAEASQVPLKWVHASILELLELLWQTLVDTKAETESKSLGSIALRGILHLGNGIDPSCSVYIQSNSLT